MIPKIMYIEEICRILPHRGKMLLIDSAEIKSLDEAEAKFYLDSGFWIFQGHFPGNPIFPGVFLTECMAQTAALLLLYPKKNRGKLPVLGEVKHMRFFRPAFPNNLLQIYVEIVGMAEDRGMYCVQASIYAAGKRVAAGEIVMVLKSIMEE